MDERPYKGMWYRIIEGKTDRWRFVVMEGPHDRPIHSGVVEGEGAAVAAAKIWIDLLRRPSS